MNTQLDHRDTQVYSGPMAAGMPHPRARRRRRCSRRGPGGLAETPQCTSFHAHSQQVHPAKPFARIHMLRTQSAPTNFPYKTSLPTAEKAFTLARPVLVASP